MYTSNLHETQTQARIKCPSSTLSLSGIHFPPLANLMSSSHSVQLGTLYLDFDGTQASPDAGGRWSNLDAELLQSMVWEEQAVEIVDALHGIIGDVPLLCSAQWQRRDHQILIRLSLLPSDAPGSTWKRIRRNERSRDLKRLFRNLKDGWAGGGDWIMGLTVRYSLFEEGESLTCDGGGR